MKEFEKWLDKSYVYIDSNSQGMAAAGWIAALKWVKKDAITLGVRGDIIREIINRELGK